MKLPPQTDIDVKIASCDLQILYNIRPQTVTAADLEGTAYDARLRNSKQARRAQMQHSTHSICRHWPLVVGLLAGATFLLLQRQRWVLLGWFSTAACVSQLISLTSSYTPATCWSHNLASCDSWRTSVRMQTESTSHWRCLGSWV